MKRLLFLGFFATTGCVVVSGNIDGDCLFDDCGGCEGDCGSDDNGGGGGEDTAECPVFHLDPAALEQGATDLIVLTAEGDFDLQQVSSVEFGGPIDVLSTIPRAGDLLLVAEVAPDAPIGAVDVYIEHSNGQLAELPGAFTILEAGTADGCE